MPLRWSGAVERRAVTPLGVVVAHTTRRSVSSRTLSTRPAWAMSSTIRLTPVRLSTTRPLSSCIRSRPSGAARSSRSTSYQLSGMVSALASSASRARMAAS